MQFPHKNKMRLLKSKALFSSILALLSINLISALGSWSYYLNSPSQLLNSEWVVFVGMFLIVFAVTFMSLSSMFGRETPQSPKELIWGIEKKGPNKGPVVIISLVIALFVSAAFSQRGFLYGYLGNNIADWALFLMGLAVIALALRMMFVWLKIPGILSTLIVLWFIIQGGYYEYIPLRMQTYEFDAFYEIISSQLMLLVLVIGLIVSIFMSLSRSRRAQTH